MPISGRDIGIVWHLLRDEPDDVIGIAFVHESFKAELHQHEEAELYMFLRGIGVLRVGESMRIVESPDVIRIDSNVVHAMKPCTSDFVALMFVFSRGPFNAIKYRYV